MNKLLPKTANNHKGFSLVELMVVISIIAILAVIGFSIFTGAQAQARDGRRRAELDALAKSLETGFDANTRVYTYTQATFNADFSITTTRPIDPQAPTRQYCIATDTASSTPPGVAANNVASTTTGCATGAPAGVTYVVIAPNATSPTGIPLPGSTDSWTLCAGMERATAPFCISSLQR